MPDLSIVPSDNGVDEGIERAKAAAHLVGWSAEAQVASLGTVLSIEAAAAGLQEKLQQELELHWSSECGAVEYDKARRQRQGSLIEDLKAAMHIRLMCVDRVGRLSEQLGGLSHGKGGKASHKRKEGRQGAEGGGEVSQRGAERMGSETTAEIEAVDSASMPSTLTAEEIADAEFGVAVPAASAEPGETE